MKIQFILLITLFISITGCQVKDSSSNSSSIKHYITSEPAGADIYIGQSRDAMFNSGNKTPYVGTNSRENPYWESGFYQFKKDGYLDSKIIFKKRTYSDRYVNAKLDPEKLAAFPNPLKKANGYMGDIYVAIYESGSATFSTSRDNLRKRWSVDCRVDAIEDLKYCTLHQNDLYITHYLINGKKEYDITIGKENYPNSEVVIKVDDDKPLRANEKNGFNHKSTLKIISRLRSANKIVTRYREWPTGYPTREIEKIKGLNLALDYLEFVIDKI